MKELPAGGAWGFGAQRWAPLWAALLTMAPFLGVLSGRVELFFDDHFRFSTPIAAMVVEAVRQHRLPLWNPWVMTGTPLIAERGSMVAHPGMLLALVMQPSHAIGTLMVLLLGVLAAGATAFLQAFRVRAVLAVGVGAAVGLSGPALSYTSAGPFLATLACWPWVLLAATRLARGKGTLAGGVALGLALLGGDLPGALLAAVVALVIFAACGGSFRGNAWRLVGVATIALLIGAGSWFPVVWALPLSERGGGIAAAEAGRWSLHPGELAGFVWPHPLGLPLPRFTFWAFQRIGSRNFLHSVWIGSTLAVAAFVSLRKGAPPIARALTVVACLLLLAATGKWTPMWTVVRPVFTFLRYPSKLAAPAALLLALAGGVMLDGYLAEPRKLRRLLVVVIAIGVLGTTVGVAAQRALAHALGCPAEIEALAAKALRGDTLRVTFLAAFALAALLLAERRRLAITALPAVLAAVVFLDVFTTTETLAWTRPSVAIEPFALAGEQVPAGRGLRVVRLQELSRVRLALTEKAFTEEQLREAALLAPLSNAIQHVDVMEPYGLYLGEVATVMAELAATDPMALAEVTATDLVLADPASRAPWLLAAVASGRLRLVGRLAAGALAFHVEHALPRSFLAFAARPAAEVDIPRSLTSNQDLVFINRDRMLQGGAFAAAAVPTLPATVGAPRSPLVPTAWRPGASSYRVSTTAPALLVELEAFMPGWHAFVDGIEQPILQADAFGRAVLVAPGDHQVEWQFRPRAVVIALLVGWVALLACVLAAPLVLLRAHAGRSSPRPSGLR